MADGNSILVVCRMHANVCVCLFSRMYLAKHTDTQRRACTHRAHNTNCVAYESKKCIIPVYQLQCDVYWVPVCPCVCARLLVCICVGFRAAGCCWLLYINHLFLLYDGISQFQFFNGAPSLSSAAFVFLSNRRTKYNNFDVCAKVK